MIELTFDEQNRLVLNGEGHPLSEVRLIVNPFWTNLQLHNTALPFLSVEATPSETDPSRITFAASPMSPVVLDGQLTLPVRYATGQREDISPRIEFEYELADDNKSFRRIITADEFPDEVQWSAISVSSTSDRRRQ